MKFEVKKVLGLIKEDVECSVDGDGKIIVY